MSVSKLLYGAKINLFKKHMKKLFVILLLLPFFSKAQEAVINFDIKNATVEKISIRNGDNASIQVLFGDKGYTVMPLNSGKATWKGKLQKPTFISLSYSDRGSNKSFSYRFYVSPKDNLSFYADVNNPKSSFSVTGLSNE